MKYDLHVHTKDSDGNFSRMDLLKRAIDLDFKYLAFTDHDYFTDIDIKEEYEKEHGKCNVEIINGVELTVDNHSNFHILAYDIKDNRKIMERLNIINKLNEDISLDIIKKINDYYGFNLDITKYKDYRICKGLIRRMIVEGGYEDNYLDAGNNYTSKSSRFYEKTIALSLDEIFELIKECGGLAILAHPSTLKMNDDELEQYIRVLIDKGLDGIEIYNSSKTNKEQLEYYKKLANTYKLLTSSGSDYHEGYHQFGVDNDYSKKLIKEISRR